MVLSPEEAKAKRDAERAALRARMRQGRKQVEERQPETLVDVDPAPLASGQEQPDEAQHPNEHNNEQSSTSVPLPQFSPDSPPRFPLPPLPAAVPSPYHSNKNGKNDPLDDVFDPTRPPTIPLPPVPPLPPSASAPVGLGLLGSDPRFDPAETQKSSAHERRSSLPYIHERGDSSASSKSSLDLDSMIRSPLPRRKRDPAIIAFPPSSDEDDQDSEIDLDSSLHIAALRSGIKDDNSSEGEGSYKGKVSDLAFPVSKTATLRMLELVKQVATPSVKVPQTPVYSSSDEESFGSFPRATLWLNRN
jgi:hypothetical protein